MLWGAGTALGEVPPYAIAYHTAKAGIRNAEVEAMLGVGGKEANGGGSEGGTEGGGSAGMRGNKMKVPACCRLQSAP